MKEITIYCADDGTKFDYEDECYAYEEECYWKNLINDYNIEIRDNLGNIPQSLSEACYINFRDDQQVKGFIDYAREREVDYYLSEITRMVDDDFYAGHWVYDSSNNEWVSLEALDTYIKRLEEIVGW